MPGYKWVPYSGIRATLPGMVCAGRDQDGASLVVGRATHNGDVLPAKAKPEHGIAYVSHGGIEHEKRQFEVMDRDLMHKQYSTGVKKRLIDNMAETMFQLTLLMPADFHWMTARHGNVPNGAIESGRTTSGETLYVGRGYRGGIPTVGKVHPSHGCLYVPFDGKEIALREYEVLVQI